MNKQLPDGWFTENNIREYRRLAELVPDGGTICELGVWKGKSLCSISEIILRKKLKVYAVDTFKGSDGEEEAHKFAKENDLRKEFEKNIKEFGIEVEIHQCRTDNPVPIHLIKDIDLLFIDAGHTYEDVSNDIKNWFPNVKGTIAGHDYSDNWKGVKQAVDERFKQSIHKADDIWSRKKTMILAYINTYGRYGTTLPLAMTSIALQTKVPDHLIIFDDNKEKQDLRNSELYKHIFQLIHVKGISCEVIFGQSKGQHLNHELANSMGYDYCWRVDDDEYAESNVLEELYKHMEDGVGAVAGIVIPPTAGQLPINFMPSKIGEFPLYQWCHWKGEPKYVTDLYSSFLYRAGIAHYNLELSPVAHREETMFSHSLYKQGYKLVVIPTAITWHFRSAGGIRSGQGAENFNHDEELWQKWVRDINKVDTDTKVCFLNSGLGDHIVFQKAILPLLKKKFKKVIIACCYPEVFEGETVISLGEGEYMVDDIKKYDVYAFMALSNWKGSLEEAFRKVYNV